MGLRTILYGYKRECLFFKVIPKEAEVVQRIFWEYISGKTMKNIADALTEEKIIYYEDKYIWTKNAVHRILENVHYIGDIEYPAIISKDVFVKANSIKNKRGGKRASDSVEIAFLKKRMFCSKCGNHFTRHKNYYGTHERWKCINGCMPIPFLDDKVLFQKLKKMVQLIIDDPALLSHVGVEAVYEPSLELIRQERDIDRMIEQNNPQFLPIKRAVYNAASQRFDCCVLDSSKAVTDKLEEFIRTLEKSEITDFELIERIVKKITVHTNGRISITFINDKTVDEQEENDYGSNNDNSKGGN